MPGTVTINARNKCTRPRRTFDLPSGSMVNTAARRRTAVANWTRPGSGATMTMIGIETIMTMIVTGTDPALYTLKK